MRFEAGEEVPFIIVELNVLSYDSSNRPISPSSFFFPLLVVLSHSSMDATAVSSGGSGQGSRSASRAGRKSGTPGWLPIEGLVAYHAMNHADEKVSESHEQERHVNAKTFFDAAIVKMDDMGLWTPASERTSGPKLPSDFLTPGG